MRALDGVDLDVRAGEVHCLLGQNGAGKSTLIKVLAGAHQPDEGEITLARRAGHARQPGRRDRSSASPRSTRSSTWSTASTVAENIFLGHEVVARRLHPARATTRKRPASCSPGSATPRSRRPGGRRGCRRPASRSSAWRAPCRTTPGCSIMDEPSAVLDQDEVDNLFRVIRDLTAEGVAVVYISHRLEEIREIGDRVTVLKDGRTVATGLAGWRTPPPSELIKLMTGRSIEYVFPQRPRRAATAGDVVLEVADLALAGRVHRRDLHRARRRDRRASPAWSAPGARRSWRRVYGARRAGDRHGHRRRQAAAQRLGRRRGQRRRRAGTGGAQEPGPAARPVGLPQHHVSSLGRFARSGFLDSRAERAAAGELHRSRSTCARPASSRAVAHPVRRQPAEGRARPLAAARLPGAAARRADPRRRRRRAQRDLRPGPRAGRRRRRRGRGVQRGRRGARSRRPGARHPRGRVVHEGPPTRSTSTRSSTWSWKEASHERQRDPDRPSQRGRRHRPTRPGVEARQRQETRPGSRRLLSGSLVGRNLGLVVALITHLRRRRDHRRRPVRQRRQRAHDPAAGRR